MKRILSAVTAGLFLAGALLLPATLRAEEKREMTSEIFRERMREKFGITEEQQGKLKTARRARRDASAASRTEMKAALRKLSDQLEDQAPEKELAATLDRIAAARKAQRAEAEKFEAGLRAILTPTQRAKMLVALKRHGGMRRRGGLGRPHGGD